MLVLILVVSMTVQLNIHATNVIQDLYLLPQETVLINALILVWEFQAEDGLALQENAFICVVTER